MKSLCTKVAILGTDGIYMLSFLLSKFSVEVKNGSKGMVIRWHHVGSFYSRFRLGVTCATMMQWYSSLVAGTGCVRASFQILPSGRKALAQPATKCWLRKRVPTKPQHVTKCWLRKRCKPSLLPYRQSPLQLCNGAHSSRSSRDI